MKPQNICYFDNNATTAVAPEVVEAMQPMWSRCWGNPSSAYSLGHDALKEIDLARTKVAALVHAEPREIIFTSGGTESINTAIHSAISTQSLKLHLVTTAVEHSATLNYCRFMQKLGYEVTYVPVDSDGRLDMSALEQAIRKDTALVSILYANNETGILFPIEEIAALCRQKGVLIHTDAVQTPGKLKLDAHLLGVDFLSLSAHKLHAPKGIGMLYVRQKTPFQPYIIGGHQERSRRGGTENSGYIVGFGKAAEMALSQVTNDIGFIQSLRDRLENGILKSISGTSLNGASQPRVCNTTNIAFKGLEAEAILMLLDQAGICASSGSACTTGSLDPSHVLKAMGLSAERSRSSVRFSLCRHNTIEEIDYALTVLPKAVQTLREATPLQNWTKKIHSPIPLAR